MENLISRLANERVLEFHNRLKRKVKKLTCDVERDDRKFNEYLSGLDQYQRYDLSQVLRKELLQIVQAVEEAK